MAFYFSHLQSFNLEVVLSLPSNAEHCRLQLYNMQIDKTTNLNVLHRLFSAIWQPSVSLVSHHPFLTADI